MLSRFARRVLRFVKSDEGLTSFEYAIGAALILVGLIFLISNIGSTTNNNMNNDASLMAPNPPPNSGAPVSGS
jgi:Flp pilus assembly pilin Flp